MFSFDMHSHIVAPARFPENIKDTNTFFALTNQILPNIVQTPSNMCSCFAATVVAAKVPRLPAWLFVKNGSTRILSYKNIQCN